MNRTKKKWEFLNKSLWNKVALNLISVLVILFLWHCTVLLVKFTKGSLFPSPKDTFERLFHLLKGNNLYNHTIFTHFIKSLWRWGTGYLLAVIIGGFTGLMLGFFPFLYQVLMPVIYILQLIPGLAWIPIALLIFGIGNISTIFMIFIIGFTPIVINTAGGIRNIPPIYVKAAKMMGASNLFIFFKVLLPGALLSIINGLRIGLANAWRVLIAAEMIVGAGVGLGYVIIQARWSLDFEAAFVSIVIIAIIGLIIEKGVFHLLEKNIGQKLGMEASA